MSARQFIRRASLVVAENDRGLDLSELRFTFKVRQWDIQTPNSASFRIYNMAPSTAQQIRKEFTRVVLSAGYVGDAPYGVIFDGNIIQVKQGRESPVDTYVDIIAADGDLAYNFAVTNTSLAAGSTADQRTAAVVASMNEYGVTQGYTTDLGGNPLPRGVALFGMAKDLLRPMARASGVAWSIQNREVVHIPVDGYLPGDAVVLNSLTGMVGMPEQTEDGISARCLLNPNIRMGRLVQIDNSSIQRLAANPSLEGIKRFELTQATVRVTDDGFYRVIVADHSGDTRGNDWYTDLVCIAAGDPVTAGLVSRGYA